MKKSKLDSLATHPLQTSYWASFREDWGNEIAATPYGYLTLHKIPKTKYRVATFIRGPMPTAKMLTELRRIAEDKNIIFIKMEPNVEKTKALTRLMREKGCTPGKTLFTPTSFWIDLTKSEEELLKSFHSKTRYNVRLAARKGVTVSEDNSPEAFEKYLALTRRTVMHQKFYAHSERYHRLMWEHLRRAKIAHLMVAKHKDKIITTWILFSWKKFLYYPYGASDERYRSLMANNLMMWEAIRFGKRQKLTTFDLWGREPGRGFTKFKEGYNSKVVHFLGTWDLVVNKPLYNVYKLADTARWTLLRAKAKFTEPRF